MILTSEIWIYFQSFFLAQNISEEIWEDEQHNKRRKFKKNVDKTHIIYNFHVHFLIH